MERIVAVSSSVFSSTASQSNDHMLGPDQVIFDEISELIESTLKSVGGVWFTSSANFSDSSSTPPLVEKKDGIEYHRIDLTESEYQNAKLGFCMKSLWPLMHFFMDRFEFGQGEHLQYQALNRRFAETMASDINANDIIWVHGLTLIPLAHHVRTQSPRATLSYYHHTSFPPFELLRCLPVWRELVCQMCEYDHLAFQTEIDRANFIEAVTNLGGETSDNGESVIFRRRMFETDVIPTGVDPENISKLSQQPLNETELVDLEKQLASQKAKLVIDPDMYNKGSINTLGLEAFDQYLNLKHSEDRSVLFQINAKPSLDKKLAQESLGILTSSVDRINAKHEEPGWSPVTLSEICLVKPELYPLFHLADVCLLTSSKNHTDTLAKEYISSQDPVDPGVLVLSELSSAAKQLPAAIQINPYDRTSAANGILKALDMSLAERKIRYTELIKTVHTNSRKQWAESCISKLRDAHFRLMEFEDAG